ncbi:putative protocadherin Fat 1-like [Apostichopus japonicus]|uniref:Putative protocadherin Fat 1-like n=1 Tax=Stichopus japonicus TaxID=307972 RepID=A0A2G8KNQ9_STIJA|nr:putative protocadherin Fat 1-like [Apostichopus japonicus]
MYSPLWRGEVCRKYHQRTTFATLDDQAVPVEYLTPQSSGALDLTKLNGDLFIGGYQDVYDLRLATDRLNGYLVTCIDYIRTGVTTLDVASASELGGDVRDGCPSDFCSPPTVITVQSSDAFFSVDHTFIPGTRSIISIKFRTRASSGLVFYLGDPAYLLLYMNEGSLVLGLNTRDSGAGVFASTTSSDFSDGNWQYVRVSREGRTAILQDETGLELAKVVYLNVIWSCTHTERLELFIGGIDNPERLPSSIQPPLVGPSEVATKISGLSVTASRRNLLRPLTLTIRSRMKGRDKPVSAKTSFVCLPFMF